MRNYRSSDSESYYIKTTGGNVIYKGNDEVTVQVNSSSYLRKTVEDLNTGELVVFDVSYAKTTLEDIEPHLHKSPLYDRATGYVYETNSKDKHIPKLRIALLQSLAQKGKISSDNLESKIMKEGRDLSAEEYKEAATYVKQTLESSPHQQRINAYIPEESSIEDWLKGRTLAPRDHNVFRILREELGKEFDKFVSYPEDRSGFYWNYRVHVVLRQAIMSKLNHWQGIHGEYEEHDHGESKINISQEVNLIKNHFLKDITPQMKAVMVTDISKIDGEKEKHLRKNDGLIGKGIVRGEVSAVASNMNSLYDILNEEGVLLGYLEKAISSYPFTHIKDHPSFSRRGYFMRFLPSFLESLKEELDDEMKFFLSFSSLVPTNEFREKSFLSVKEKIMNGDIDSYYNWPKNTTLNLTESFTRVRKTIPHKVHSYKVGIMLNDRMKTLSPSLFNQFHLPPSKVRKFMRELKEDYNLSDNSMGRYFGTGIFFLDFISDFMSDYPFFHSERSMTEGSKYEEIITSDLFKDREKLRKVSTTLEKIGFLFTREYTKSVLKKHGLEEIVDLRKGDFVYGELGIPFPTNPRI